MFKPTDFCYHSAEEKEIGPITLIDLARSDSEYTAKVVVGIGDDGNCYVFSGHRARLMLREID